jgi:hypothetical protein
VFKTLLLKGLLSLSCNFIQISNPKSHSLCSEAFYQQQVFDELSTTKAHPDSSILEILSRVHEQDDDYIDPFVEKFLNLELLSHDDILSRLSTQELQDFHSKMQNIPIPQWNPWWFHTLPPTKPPLLDLASSKPILVNHKMLLNLAEILFSYCFTCRYLQGDLFEDLNESTRIMSALSFVLSHHVPFAFSSSIHLHESLKNTCFKETEFDFSFASMNFIMQDVLQIIKDKESILASLSEISLVFRQAKLLKASKKLEFYFVLLNQDLDLSALVHDLSSISNTWQQEQDKLNRQNHPKVLIQEL